jgi:predicted transposase/invertase (TIGR01784 family)
MTTPTPSNPLPPIRLRYPINPLVDCVFKALFGQEENKGLLIHFLNSILRPTSPISDITYLNPINDPRTETEKLTIIDIRAQDELHITYQIEMQLVIHKALPERMLYNWTSIYNRLISTGDNFERLTPVISIWLLANNLLDTPAHHHHFQIRDAASGARLSDHLHIHTLELKKWKPPSNTNQNPADQWLHFFHDARRWQELPNTLTQHPQMRHAMTVLKHFSDDDKARYEYERRMQIQSIQATIDSELKEKTQQIAELESQRIELESQRDQLESQRDQLESRVHQEAIARAQAEQHLLAAQQQQESQTLALRQSLQSLYIARFGPLPPQLTLALTSAPLPLLTSWLPLFASALASDLLALASSPPESSHK